MERAVVKAAAQSSLYIYMNDLLIGHLTKLRSGGLTLTYDPQWLATPGARPLSLSLPLRQQPYTGDLVYNFFDNLLPDNDLIKNRIQVLFQAPSKHPFDLLARIGHDCVGAVQLSADEQAPQVKSIRAQALNPKKIADLLKNYQYAPLGMTGANQDFRISIAGAQEKTAFLLQKDRWYRPLGATPTTHIFKLPIGFLTRQQIDLRDSCENEWLCSKIAAAFGLPAAACEIQQFEDVKVLVVERFDRKIAENSQWIMRLPQEDMCQALGYSPAFKYQAEGGPGIKEIMSLLLSSEEATVDREKFFRYQILFWLLAAIDGHAKNFSLFIEPAGRFRLTPLYDVMSMYPLLAKKQLPKQKIKMTMALIGRNNHYLWHNFQRHHFMTTAKFVHFSPTKAEQILDDMLAQIDDVINKTSAVLPKNFPNNIAESVFKGLLNCRDKLR